LQLYVLNNNSKQKNAQNIVNPSKQDACYKWSRSPSLVVTGSVARLPKLLPLSATVRVVEKDSDDPARTPQPTTSTNTNVGDLIAIPKRKIPS
jgi:hypothetical protein